MSARRTASLRFRSPRARPGRKPLSIVEARLNGNTAVACYLGEDGFRAFDGMTSLAIGAQKVDRFFFNDLSPRYLSMVQGGTVPGDTLIYWLYVSKTGANAGLYDRILIYNTMIGRWSLCDLSATPAEWGTRFLSPGLTLDALDIYGSLDAVPAPLDSGVWAGGSPVLAAFDSSHKLNLVNGPAMAPTVETSESAAHTGAALENPLGSPLMRWRHASIAIATRDRLIDATVYGGAVAVNSIGECPQRTTGRYARAQMTLPAGSVFTHLQGVDLTVRPEGKR
jgi:hypothetical protein